jgi:hypothetical protein
MYGGFPKTSVWGKPLIYEAFQKLQFLGKQPEIYGKKRV